MPYGVPSFVSVHSGASAASYDRQHKTRLETNRVIARITFREKERMQTTKKQVNWSLAGRRAWRTKFKKMGLSNWHASEASGLLPCKQGERERIGNFLSRYHAIGLRMHLFNLAGSRFLLEKYLLLTHQDAIFTTMERDTKFLRIARRIFDTHAPGGALTQDSEDKRVFTNKRTTLLNIPAGGLSDYVLSEKITAGWFDGMGLLNSPDFAAFIKSLRKKIDPNVPVPFVFTLQLGRDANSFYKGIRGGVVAKRVRKLVRMLAKVGLAFDLKSFWAYGSDTNGPLKMFNVCGVMTRKPWNKSIKKSWGLISYQEFVALKSTMGDGVMSSMLDYKLSTLRRIKESAPLDQVAQAQLHEVIHLSQSLRPRVGF